MECGDWPWSLCTMLPAWCKSKVREGVKEAQGPKALVKGSYRKCLSYRSCIDKKKSPPQGRYGEYWLCHSFVNKYTFQLGLVLELFVGTSTNGMVEIPQLMLCSSLKPWSESCYSAPGSRDLLACVPSCSFLLLEFSVDTMRRICIWVHHPQ